MKNGKKLIILVCAVAFMAAFGVFLKVSPAATGFVWDLSRGGEFFLPLVVVSAILDSINPCAFSVLLLTIAFLVSIGQLRKGILKMGAAYIAGLFLVYLLIGLGILRTLTLFGTPNLMGRVGAALLIALGILNLINVFFPKFPVKLGLPRTTHEKMATLMEKASMPAAFGLGILVGLFEFPCTGGPYLMILGLLHDRGTFISGFWYLILYNLIFVLPLAVILGIASNETLLARVQAWRKENVRGMHLWGGLAMVALGLIILLVV